jgi:hypothetical protein
MTDKRLLDVYMRGWHDELDGRFTIQTESVLIKSYNLGKADALAGDECEELDNKTNKEILEQIKGS